MFLLLLLTAYLIGSIPWAVWVSKGLYGVDVRTQGSQNAGATNTFRVLGKKAGIAVLLLDVTKGVGAVLLAETMRGAVPDIEQFRLLQLGLAVAATVGHVFPVFAGFKGGKGVATLTGAVFYIYPEAALIALAAFVAVFIGTRFISLSSMTAAVVLACTALVMYRIDYLPLVALLVFIPILVMYTHRSNIQRLIHGNENKMSIRIRK